MTTKCAHHWILEPPVARSSRVAGTCRKCGATKDFAAFYEEGFVTMQRKGGRVAPRLVPSRDRKDYHV